MSLVLSALYMLANSVCLPGFNTCTLNPTLCASLTNECSFVMDLDPFRDSITSFGLFEGRDGEGTYGSKARPIRFLKSRMVLSPFVREESIVSSLWIFNPTVASRKQCVLGSELKSIGG
uniref:Uncharacterized protein n=1 Tax=Opuntia streptacantha TaxID=393608 RepID=A0A7C9E896_OPUST